MKKKKRLSAERLFSPSFLWRILCYGLLILVLATAEYSFFSRLSFLPTLPDCMLGAVVAVSLLDNRRASTVFACAAGLCLDAVGGVGIPWSAGIYWLIVALTGSFGEKMFPKFSSFAALLIPSVLVRELFGLLKILLPGGMSVQGIVWKTVGQEALLTLLFSLPLYFLVKLCMIPFREKRR